MNVDPMSYYRIAEMTIVLSSGLTFALVGWWEIVAEIRSALEWHAAARARDRNPSHQPPETPLGRDNSGTLLRKGDRLGVTPALTIVSKA
jgi:hypothetical protein